MANEVKITVTGEDKTGPLYASQTARMAKMKGDAESLQRKIGDLSRKLGDIPNREIKIQADITQAELKLKKLREKAKTATGDAKVQVDADIRSAEARIAQLRSRLKAIPDEKVRLEVEIQNAQRNLNRLAGAASGVVSPLGNAAGATSGLSRTAAMGARPIAIVSAVVAGLGAVSVTAVPAILALAGAMASTANAAAGLGASAAVLGFGFGGLGDAMKAAGEKTAGAGRAAGGAADQQKMAARQVRDATERLADTQRAARRAQEDVTRAREAETRRLKELSRDLVGAQLDEEDAVLAVGRAEEELALARKRRPAGHRDIAEAELAYRQAVHAVDEAKAHTQDLRLEQDAANKAGVDGSEQVQAALERQADAQRDVAKAQRDLKEASEKTGVAAAGAAGGVNKYAEAMAKLSPNAQELVRTLVSLQPAFAELKKSVQDRFLEGFAGDIRGLAGKWLPTLHDMLGTLAGRMNGVVRTLMRSVGEPQFISDISEAVDGFGRSMERIGQAVAGPLVEAFGTLARASVPYMERLGELLAGVIEKFSAWIEAADTSGRLTTFIEDAADSLQSLWDVTGLVLGVFRDLFMIAFPTNKTMSDSFLGGFEEALRNLRKSLADPQVQKNIRAWIDGVADFMGQMNADWIPGVINFVSVMVRSFDRTRRIILTLTAPARAVYGAFRSAFTGIISLGGRLLSWFGGLRGRMGSATSGLFEGIPAAFRSAINWVIRRWNGLSFTLPSFEAFGAQIGGATLNTPNIPYLARGGIAGGLAVVGDRGRELVRLPHGSTVYPAGQSEGMINQASSSGQPIAITLMIGDRSLGEVIIDPLRKVVQSRGGNVQAVLGR